MLENIGNNNFSEKCRLFNLVINFVIYFSVITASKKKKVKGKTVNLNDFLSDGTSNAPGTSYVMANKSWAEQTDEAEGKNSFVAGNTDVMWIRDYGNHAALVLAANATMPLIL